jgi:murein DD-endopeptidase MepM/ murein hydrolase activator NlpD
MELKQKQRDALVVWLQRSLNKGFYTISAMSFVAVLLLSFSIPQTTNAGIFSKIFSSDAKADTIASDNNSQTAPVLEAQINPNGINGKTQEKISMGENNVLVGEVGSLGTALDVEDYPAEDEISVYTTKNGDTLAKIAKMYNVSVNTIVWANDGLDPKKALKEGTSLLIMPINGVSHTIKKGDTLNKIAKKYSADADEIARFNGVTDETLIVGEIIIVPNGEISVAKSTTKTTKVTTTVKNGIKVFTGNGKGTSPLISGYGGASVGSYFRRPVNCIITQGLHGKNGIDIGCPIGTPVAAAADGTVIAAKSGWNGGYGNMVIISHPNGTQTVYGHLSKIDVTTGQNVNDGQIIGKTGNSGQSTGPHLHFEIRGARQCYVDSSCR